MCFRWRRFFGIGKDIFRSVLHVTCQEAEEEPMDDPNLSLPVPLQELI